MEKIIKIPEDYHDTRLDKFLKKNFPQLTQSYIEKVLRKGIIKVNKKKQTSRYKVLKNDEIIIFNFSEKIYNQKSISNKIVSIPKKFINLFKKSIIYEEKNFLILNKWAGISTQGGSKINVSLDDIIKNYNKNYKLVHRLDKETSGLIIIAKNLIYAKIFGKLFKEQQVNKIYVALCQGKPKNKESEVNLKIKNKKEIIKEHQTVTMYKVLETKNNISTILFSPKTGKTHQIRIVCKYLGCPIIGDNKYNSQKNNNLEKLKLNSYFLSFKIFEKKYEFFSKFSDDFVSFFNKNNLNKIDINKIKNFLKVF